MKFVKHLQFTHKLARFNKLGARSMRPCNRNVNINKGSNPRLDNAAIRQGFLGGGFKYFLFSPLFGEDFQFD